ncbi:MAG: N-acetylglucosamine-6-phosphate deacetylase [Lactobacillus sp.]|jgi:N-acetylglucosamine-6-phosphate deacetylase|uniref:N-acetylglucosamine-6-phosphate deacetylase n=1 Tax=Lacticaseibacillus suilingensis TaxID=2799577 RepID=A0ABW4BF05_9LACO|nr:MULTISPECIES: N-acetylglucosamine-6-phosphate deacetylase [Lacticaseibacillus]MCI1894935.1 N-acetylglucosamine-6-phosphate deacetylase [Lactobacillus sp.]MCI1917189.1 N-acetylglucosamine-6-phosphate deacetylase [Lactobacillus sp.]MCI1942200.1 N-acetylglucosamine-6-phosphate deacetylase [Lactobacillus sp.]MCI1972642.1 N-acetylglucosamine-6-phosphate deacetylase [Lactobacillus sp.]MCI2017423.1 N-acetylglucosamine-6-phosphate deacetylase [Lactobacillus sp.]
MSYYIHAAKFFLKNTTENGGWLEVTDDGKFGDFIPAYGEKPAGEIKDYGDQWIAPGLVDTHIHGMLGHDVMDNDWEGINEMSEGLLKAGVTSWLPTTLTGPFEQLNDVCKTIGDHAGEEKGAKIQGIYFEGPFFTEEHKGAQNPKYFRDPSIKEYDEWQASAKGLLQKMALAPEREGAVEFTKHMSQDGKVVALGHSSATFEQAKACVEAGATVFCHTFNGMSGLNHRAPGMVGAAMYMQIVDDELICDGHHVRPEVVGALIKDKTPEHIALITDCMQAGMMPDGEYMLGEFPVIVADGMAKLKDGAHSLAGSILQLKDAIKNVVDWNDVVPEDAIKMGALVPARSCKIDDKCGSILPGRDADYLVLNKDMSLAETYLDGVSRYQA